MSEPITVSQVWDLTGFFAEFDGADYTRFKDELRRDLAAQLAAASALADLDAATAVAWAAVFNSYETSAARLTHLSSYLSCLGSADAANERCKQEEAALAGLAADASKLVAELARGFRAASERDWETFCAQSALAGAGHTLSRLRQDGRHRMSRAEERLAADLGVDGIAAWGRLYDTVTGKMTFEMEWPDGRRETVPMAQCRALMANPDRAVRRAAFAGGNKVWAAHEDVMAAALNALAGTRLTLYAGRRLPHFLDQPLFDNAVSRETIDAMLAAIVAQAEVPRRILRLGARRQGTPAVAWYDLEAARPLEPLPPLSWAECTGLVGQAFDAAYPDLGAYFQKLLARRWVESEKRANKRSGAFLTGSPVINEERIYMTFSDTMHDVTTLAHECGHGWHSHLLGALRPCAQDYPMALAETASTFAEMVLLHGLLSDPAITPARKAFLLDQQTSQMTAYLLNIPVRFEFERQFYEERRTGEVSVSRLKELMVTAQRHVYGDTLEVDGEDPWFWASKPHFFISGLSFYNYPYAFGFLLSQALFAEFRRSGAAFLPRYESFLRATGGATCEEAVRTTLGWNIRSAEFWAGAIRNLDAPIREYEALLAAQ